MGLTTCHSHLVVQHISSGEDPMQSQVIKNITAVQAGWTETERQNRKKLAGAMQLHLGTLVVLAELAVPPEDSEPFSCVTASAC
jgi:hypothetical protein